MTPADLSTLEALPDEALVPVRWVRGLIESIESGDCSEIGHTVLEVAAATNRAPSTVRTWCAEGRLPGARRLRGREWRIPAAALRALLDGDTPDRPEAVARLSVPRGGLGAWRDES